MQQFQMKELNLSPIRSNQEDQPYQREVNNDGEEQQKESNWSEQHEGEGEFNGDVQPWKGSFLMEMERINKTIQYEHKEYSIYTHSQPSNLTNTIILDQQSSINERHHQYHLPAWTSLKSQKYIIDFQEQQCACQCHLRNQKIKFESKQHEKLKQIKGLNEQKRHDEVQKLGHSQKDNNLRKMDEMINKSLQKLHKERSKKILKEHQKSEALDIKQLNKIDGNKQVGFRKMTLKDYRQKIKISNKIERKTPGNELLNSKNGLK